MLKVLHLDKSNYAGVHEITHMHIGKCASGLSQRHHGNCTHKFALAQLSKSSVSDWTSDQGGVKRLRAS